MSLRKKDGIKEHIQVTTRLVIRAGTKFGMKGIHKIHLIIRYNIRMGIIPSKHEKLLLCWLQILPILNEKS